MYNYQGLETAQVPISRQVGKETVVHLHDGVVGSHKEGTFTLVTAWVDLESITLSERSQSEKDKYNVISLICGIQ